MNSSKEFLIHQSAAMRMYRKGQGPSRASLKRKTSRGSRLWSSPRARQGFKKFSTLMKILGLGQNPLFACFNANFNFFKSSIFLRIFLQSFSQTYWKIKKNLNEILGALVELKWILHKIKLKPMETNKYYKVFLIYAINFEFPIPLWIWIDDWFNQWWFQQCLL